MNWRSLGCVLLIAACVDIKPFRGGNGSDAGPGDAPPPGLLGDVTIVMDGAGATATGPGYVMHFATAAPHYPDSFFVNGHQVLATGTACERASKMGVNVYPAGRSDAMADPVSATLSIEIPGPTIARLTINWNAALTCGTATVTSLFTFFPDGRISRFDNITPTVTGTCTCGNASDVDPMTETLYAADVAQHIYGPGVSSPMPTPTGGISVDDTACLSVPEHAFNLFLADGLGSHAQMFSTAVGDVGVVYQTASNSTWAESFVIPLSASTSCQSAIAANIGYAFPPVWYVNTTAAPLTDVFDGIAGGSTLGGTFGVTTGATATIGILHNTVDTNTDHHRPDFTPVGYAFGLKFNATYTQFMATKNAVALGHDEVRFQSFPASPRQVIVWLRDSFTIDDTIVVTGMP